MDIFAHREICRKAPGNTIPGRDPVKMAPTELTGQTGSRDGGLIVVHDDVVEVAGVDQKCLDLTFDKINRLRC